MGVAQAPSVGFERGAFLWAEAGKSGGELDDLLHSLRKINEPQKLMVFAPAIELLGKLDVPACLFPVANGCEFALFRRSAMPVLEQNRLSAFRPQVR
jgi:hypothetical protein